MDLPLQPEKVARTWGVIRSWVICEINKHGMETQQHAFRKSAESRKVRSEQAGGKEGLGSFGEWPGGPVVGSILVS